MGTITTLSKSIVKSARKVMVLGILIAALGVAALVYPGTAGNVTAIAIGAFLFIGGVLRLAVAASSISWKSLAVSVFYGLIMAAAGIWAMANPDMGLDALTLLIAAYFVVDGATQIYYSFKLRPIGGGSYLLVNGLISVGLGALIFAKFPESSYYVIGIYVGVKLLIDGLILAITGGKVAQFVKTSGNNLEDVRDRVQKEINRVIEEEEARQAEAQATITPEAN